MVQNEDGSVVDRQPGEGSIEDVGVGRSVVEGSVGRSRFAFVLGVEQPDLANPRSTSPAELLSTGVQADPGEPGIEGFGVAQRIAMAPRRDERLLGCVGGVGLIAENRE